MTSIVVSDTLQKYAALNDATKRVVSTAIQSTALTRVKFDRIVLFHEAFRPLCQVLNSIATLTEVDFAIPYDNQAAAGPQVIGCSAESLQRITSVDITFEDDILSATALARESYQAIVAVLNNHPTIHRVRWEVSSLLYEFVFAALSTMPALATVALWRVIHGSATQIEYCLAKS